MSASGPFARTTLNLNINIMNLEEILIQLQPENRKSFSINLDGHHGRAIVDRARDLGFRQRESLSECRVASFEEHLGHDGWCLDVIESRLFGAFTDVSLYRLP